LNKNDLVALNFRDDLIKLLNKYDCEITGSCMDDGYMNLEFDFDFGNYIMKGKYNNYNIMKENSEKYESIMDTYILSCFSEPITMDGLSNVKVHGIFTNDENKAENKIQEIYNKLDKNNIYRLINSKNQKELQLLDGSRYVWIKPIDSSRGYKCTEAFIDRELTLEELQYNVLPICIYCGKDTVKVF